MRKGLVLFVAMFVFLAGMALNKCFADDADKAGEEQLSEEGVDCMIKCPNCGVEINLTQECRKQCEDNFDGAFCPVPQDKKTGGRCPFVPSEPNLEDAEIND
ncbi:MAG: hypothetical protein COV72_05420 [Candidatus Omnitrophica bacterium CG11_big_fil_rev_8_21_14_0_20_42_13]|uniref:4Fe-4S ferredoxin-type domain-containing protein n=1 Tax=Candidatus Ghiorseimicrobium undicola TaxID=1974746 RepID=A0A2H0LZT8_9BACT|nr:MAG: hypothetical protein COV72_05420 [Candidatus Omnitrophica bacterium CG11_big_fil_rev_8_21_14_0_20_42_13]